MIIRQTIVLTFLILKCAVSEANEELEKFQKLFMQKRIEQLGAVKNILKLDEIKRKTLLDQITNKLFQVLSAGRTDLENEGFVAGRTEFNVGQPVMEKVSLVLENTCLACDLLMRLPDETSERLEANPSFDTTLRWAIGWAADTQFLDDSSQTLLNLASQELGLIERQHNYVNPYRKEKKPVKKFEDPPPKKKKEKKKLQRGPKMTHGEL